MTGPELDAQPLGYPGFQVMPPPPLRRTGATLKRVALAKVSGITMFSASFRDENHLFEPWLTLLVDRGDGMTLFGVYRTDEGGPDGEPVDPEVPTACLRVSEWDRDADLERIPEPTETGTYLSFGPQVAHTFTFVNEHSHPGLAAVMAAAVDALTAGVSIEGGPSEAVDWAWLDLDLADDRLSCRFDYSPLTAHCPVVEAGMPVWTEAVAELAGQPGFEPDATITLSITRSVPELVSAPMRAPHRA